MQCIEYSLTRFPQLDPQSDTEIFVGRASRARESLTTALYFAKKNEKLFVDSEIIRICYPND